MNIEQAKRVPLHAILNILGIKSTQLKNVEDDPITYVRKFLAARGENAAEADAVRWIINMTGQSPRIAPVIETIPTTPEDESRFVEGIKPISNRVLVRHLERLGIPLIVANAYMKEIRICQQGTKKIFSALGFRNEIGGWVYKSPFRKGFIGKQYLTFIRGTQVKPDGINLFKDDEDFMAAVIRYGDGRSFKNDSIVLNGIFNLHQATPFIKGYGYRMAHTWMDNCAVGRAATHSLNDFFKTEDRLIHMPMNQLYARFSSVSAHHGSDLDLFSE